MKEEVTALKCGRENDLIDFLYGELTEDDARNFQRHMQDCTACGNELVAFRNVRESVVNWRNESLGGPASHAAVLEAGASISVNAQRGKPSALVALQQFFDLSPLWLKGAVALASVLFCLLAGLAIARLRVNQPAPLVDNSKSPMYSEQQVNAIVRQRVQDQLQRIKSSLPVPNETVTAENKTLRSSGRKVIKQNSKMVHDNPQTARRPLSKTEREQLAADLRLITTKTDSELDLLDDRINQ